MPTETFARPDDLLEKLDYPADNTQDADLQKLLEEAHREMGAVVGKKFAEQFQFNKLKSDEETLDNVLDLTFAPVFRVEEVLRLDDKVQLDNADFTTDKEEGTVTVDSGYVDDNFDRGDYAQVSYVPAIFKDLEVWLAVLVNKTEERIQFEESEETNLYENAAIRAQKLINTINKQVPAANVRDGAVYRGTK